jgi:hypothetical protein
MLHTSLKEHGILKKTKTLVTDQGANIIKAGRLEDLHHLFCFAHKVNLCITKYGVDSAEDISTLVQRVIEIVKVFRYKASSVRKKKAELQETLNELMDIAEQDHNYYSMVDPSTIPNSTLKRHCKTRWSSIAISAKSVYDNRSVVHPLLIEFGRSELCLTRRETDALKKLLDFLDLFKKLVDRAQGENYPTISLVWPAVLALKLHCSEEIFSDNVLFPLIFLISVLFPNPIHLFILRSSLKTNLNQIHQVI